MAYRFQDYLFHSDSQPLHCESLGDPAASAAVIFIHGLASNATRWRELMSHSQLQNRAHLLAINLRGHGKSMTWQKFQREDWCADIAQLIRSLAVPCILVGHSLGAQIALQVAATQANTNLYGLVLIDPIFAQALTGKLRTVARFRQPLRLVASMLRGLYRLGWHKRHFPYRDLQQLDEQTRTILAQHPEMTIADLYMDPLADLRFMPLANYLQDLYEVTRPLPSLKIIEVPSLVLLSAGASTSEFDKSRKLLDELPDSRIEHIDADHWLLTEQPEQARRIIDQWCLSQLEMIR